MVNDKGGVSSSLLYLLSLLAGSFIFSINLTGHEIFDITCRALGIYLALQSCCLFVCTELKKDKIVDSQRVGGAVIKINNI